MTNLKITFSAFFVNFKKLASFVQKILKGKTYSSLSYTNMRDLGWVRRIFVI